MAAKIPRTNPITLSAIINGTAAMMSASNGVSAQVRTDLHSLNSSVTLVRIGDIDSLSVAALAYCTRVTDAVPATSRALPFVVATKSFTLSRNDINHILVYGL
jgi:hypothetical protein